MDATLILGILTLLLTGTNIISLTQIRQLRRKTSAEADQAQIQTLNLIISSQSKEIQRLNDRVVDLETKYNALYDRCIVPTQQ